jgi:hypothetical protein
MSMHTPGKWAARQQFQARTGRSLGWIIETEDGSRIGWSDYADATTKKGEEAPFEQSGENARLIAAAPDLLEALKAAYEDAKDDICLDPKMVKRIINQAEGKPCGG